MRLIREQIFRAFPELDTFSDDQCRRFVIAANSSWVRRIIRWGLVGLAGILGVILVSPGILVVTAWLANRSVGPVVSALIFVATGAIGFSIALIPTLILRDYLLRLTIRRLIRRCGACPKCRYSLLGIRVGPDATITCPECGLKLDIDPALGELATDEEGAPVYKPEVARDHQITIELRRRRHRRFWKIVGAAAALLVLSAGVWYLWLIRQAHRAASERDAVQQIHKLQVAMWPVATTSLDASADGKDAFNRYLDLLTEAGKASDVRNYTLPPATTGAVMFEAETLLPGADVKAFEKTSGEGSFAASRVFTLQVLEQTRESGLAGRMRDLLDLKAPIRVMAPPNNDPLIGQLIPDLGLARAAARLNNARMIDALLRNDRREYMEALEESLVIAQVVERQGLLIDRLVAIAIDAMIFRRLTDNLAQFPDAAWIEDILAILKRRGEHAPLASTFEIERLACLDTIQWYFSDPKRVAKAHFGIGNNDLLSGWSGSGVSGSIGTYEGNKQTLNDYYAAQIAAAAQSRATRTAALSPPTNLMLLNALAPALARTYSSEDVNQYEQRACTLALAAELYRRTKGYSPKTPDEVAQLLPSPAYLIDPWSEKPFTFTVRDESGKDGRPFEIRDGDDDEPMFGPTYKNFPKTKPAPKK